ncbi:hypothetical protein D3C86_1891870 [compost metagenome]
MMLSVMQTRKQQKIRIKLILKLLQRLILLHRLKKIRMKLLLGSKLMLRTKTR